jgi:hypothetical protein
MTMRRLTNHSIPLVCAAILCLAFCRGSPAAPLAEQYLLDGKLAEGTKALQERLRENDNDDQARFGLGVVQFLQAFEHLGGSLYQYGLRTEKSFLRPPPQLKEFLPQNPNPEQLTYPAARRIVQTFLDDITKAEATLAKVQDADVKLPLHVARIRIDPFGQNKPISAVFLFGRLDLLSADARRQAEKLVIGFDRGDVSWLRGYCHLLAAWCELLLAVDGRNAFECSAHLLFQTVETPHTFLLEKRRPFDEATASDVPLWSDVVSLFHQLTRLSVTEPARTRAALEHLEAGLTQAQEMWTFILKETDDDNEWIPNPKQTGVLGIRLTQEMIDTWRETLKEAEQVIKGKKLIPFWRGEGNERGVNLRRVFTEPRTFDPVEWVQGTAATPYLEKGPVTKLADPRLANRLNKAFGGPMNLVGFGFWFN